jgi:hypothetical protein
MRTRKITLWMFGLFFLNLAVACNKSIGYIEVRNQTKFVIKNVSWGQLIDLGTINSNEENGIETDMHGSEFIYLSIDTISFRSQDKISIDAKASATFIVKDTVNLVTEVK